MLFTLAKKSLLNRKTSVSLTLFSIVVSVFLLLSVEHLRVQVKEGFSRTISGVDLIVGSRTSSINLLLSSVFRVGNNPNGMSWDTYQKIRSSAQVKWSIPLSLGDSHKGFAVLGTSQAYFDHFQYANKRALVVEQGHPFRQPLDVVLGAKVAEQLQYKLGQKIVLSHGVGSVSFSHHDQYAFTIVGILAKTGTPVDNTLHIQLSDVTRIHTASDQHGAEQHEHGEHKEHGEAELHPEQISGVLLGLNNRIAVLTQQRFINQYSEEPLSAIIPGVALAELWQIVGVIESILIVVSGLVLVSSLLGLSTMMLASLRERINELKILRIVGAGPLTLFWLIELEALLLGFVGIVLGIILLWLAVLVGGQWLTSEFSLSLSTNILTIHTFTACAAVLVATAIVALIPAISAYRRVG